MKTVQERDRLITAVIAHLRTKKRPVGMESLAQELRSKGTAYEVKEAVWVLLDSGEAGLTNSRRIRAT